MQPGTRPKLRPPRKSRNASTPRGSGKGRLLAAAPNRDLARVAGWRMTGLLFASSPGHAAVPGHNAAGPRTTRPFSEAVLGRAAVTSRAVVLGRVAANPKSAGIFVAAVLGRTAVPGREIASLRTVAGRFSVVAPGRGNTGSRSATPFLILGLIAAAVTGREITSSRGVGLSAAAVPSREIAGLHLPTRVCRHNRLCLRAKRDQDHA